MHLGALLQQVQCLAVFLCSVDKDIRMAGKKSLTRFEGQFFESLKPLIGRLDRLQLGFLSSSGVSLLCGVAHDARQIIRVDCIQDVEEVLSSRPLLVSILVLEVDVEVGVIFQVLPKAF